MYLRGLAAPTFYNSAGAPIVSIQCGQQYTFNVPGYSEVWLTQSKNGNPGYNGPLPVPMNPYTANCGTEVGTYVNAVFTVDRSGGVAKPGQPLGTVTFQVLPPATGPAAGQGGSFNPTGTSTTTAATGAPAPAASPTSAPVVVSGGGYVPPDFGSGPAPAPAPAAGGLDTSTLLLVGALALGVLFLGRRGK